MRNIEKQAQQGRDFVVKHHEGADITAKELKSFLDEFEATAKEHGTKAALYDAVANSFYMGVSVGRRNA